MIAFIKYTALMFLVNLQIVLSAITSHAQEVRPAAIELTQAVRTAAITVTNPGSESRKFEISLISSPVNRMDSDQELVFYPKFMTMNAGEVRVIRIGYPRRVPPIEKTYTLRIASLKELKKESPAKDSIEASEVNIHVLPAVTVNHLEINSIGLKDNWIQISVRNAGNERADITGIKLKGQGNEGDDVLIQELAGFYLPAGESRTVRSLIPFDSFRRIHTLSVEAWSLGRNLRVGCTAVLDGTTLELRGLDCSERERT